MYGECGCTCMYECMVSVVVLMYECMVSVVVLMYECMVSVAVLMYECMVSVVVLVLQAAHLYSHHSSPLAGLLRVSTHQGDGTYPSLCACLLIAELQCHF